jgi:peptidoglycan/LPS O-acetylase OafA/YrhL
MSSPATSEKTALASGFSAGAVHHAGNAAASRATSHRSDIDGLRAVAIVPVVLFHLGIPWFGGGFIGVDVFFVISGFLITSIIFQEMTGDGFSLLAFYERRIRRIFPALFCMLAVTTLAAAALLLPLDFKAFSQSLVASSVFGANLLFWKTAGYFDGPALMKPLLHTWTLSVEEQFYIFYPVVLFLLLRFLPRRRAMFAVAGMALVSFLASCVLLRVHPDAVFYLPHFRAWELLLGALLAMPLLRPPQSQRLRDLLSVAGIAMIAYGALAFSEQTAFPGLNALYPCIGAGLILYAGTGGHSFVGGFLGGRVVVWMGLISYSLYLWHWPLIVFARYFAIRDLTQIEKAAIVAASLLLATLSWRLVEQPFRGKQGILSRPALFGLSFAAMAAFIAIGLSGHMSGGFPERLPDAVVKLASRQSEQDSYLQKCVDLPAQRIVRGDVCSLGDAMPADSPRFLLWGDSHGAALASAFDAAARRSGRAGLFVGKNACPPLAGIERHDSWHACGQTADAVLDLIRRDRRIDTVVLVGRWAFYARGTRYGAEDGKPVVISPDGISGNQSAFRRGFEQTLLMLRERGVKVVLLAPVPEVGWHVPSGMARAALFDRSEITGPTLDAYRTRQRPVSETFDELTARFGVRVVDVVPVLCPGTTCLVERAGQPLYRDDDHLSVEGARLVGEALDGRF